jgi:hypothetical protein
MTLNEFTNEDDAPEDGLGRAGSGRDSRLDAADEVLVEALANGSSYAEAGDLAGVSARTVRRRMSDPTFSAEVAKRRNERLGVVSGRLSQLAERALDVLEGALASERAGEALRAADMVLSLDRRYREQVDFAARLLAVEDGLAGGLDADGSGHE